MCYSVPLVSHLDYRRLGLRLIRLKLRKAEEERLMEVELIQTEVQEMVGKRKADEVDSGTPPDKKEHKTTFAADNRRE